MAPPDRAIVRTSARAVIIEEGRILALQLEHPNRFFTLPGGGQYPGEALAETLRRECLEETGFAVEVGDLIFVRDYIADNHEFAQVHPGLHQLELIFRCYRKSGASVTIQKPDLGQKGIAWLPVDRLSEYELFPKGLHAPLLALEQGRRTRIYLGDIN